MTRFESTMWRIAKWYTLFWGYLVVAWLHAYRVEHGIG